MIDPVEREREAIAYLDSWPWERGGTLIGGYALAAYGSPRFSVDLDLVLTARQYNEISPILAAERSTLLRLPNIVGTNPPRVERLQLGLVTVDLMIDGVVDRLAQVVVEPEWVGRDAIREVLSLRTGRTSAAVSVARIEALWALKLLAGRDQDLADLLALSDRQIRVAEIRAFLAEHPNSGLTKRTNLLKEKLASPKTYLDTISRLSRGRPSHPSNRAVWNRFVALVEGSLP